MSIVRQNMLTRKGYTPYCGAENCFLNWPRTIFNGRQFICACGWTSSLEPSFIAQYRRFNDSSTPDNEAVQRDEGDTE